MFVMILLVAIIIIAYFLIRTFTYWKYRHVDQISITWFLKEVVKVIRNERCLTDLCITGYKLFPEKRYIGIYQLTKPALMIKDADLLKEMTVKNFEHFADHQFLISERFEPIWAKNLFIIKGKRWRTIRSILSASFTGNKMKIMFGLIYDCVQDFTKYFSEQEGDVIEVEFKDIYTRFANDVLATTMYGIKIDSLKDKSNEFYIMAKKIFNFTHQFLKICKLFILVEWPSLYEFLGLPVFDTSINSFFTKIIDDTIKLREKHNIVRPDMIHLLMEAKKRVQAENSVNSNSTNHPQSTTEKKENIQLTNLDIAAQAFFFFVAGYDAVATALSFLSYELVVNPDIQNRLRDEIEKTYKECNEELTYDVLTKMKYIDMVISESLRKWPPLFAVDRLCTKPYIIEPKLPGEKPVFLEKNSIIWLPIFALHRNPKYFPDPEKFDPERFNDENKKNINSGAYIPFGPGPRSCIAPRFSFMEIKTIIFFTLLRFELVPIEKSQIPVELKPTTVNLTAKDGLWFGLKKIER